MRVLVPESTFEVRNRTATATVPSAGNGRYKITGDGKFYAGKKSLLPLRVSLLDELTTVTVATGNLYEMQAQKVRGITEEEQRQMGVNLDELQDLSTHLTPPPGANELPKGIKK